MVGAVPNGNEGAADVAADWPKENEGAALAVWAPNAGVVDVGTAPNVSPVPPVVAGVAAKLGMAVWLADWPNKLVPPVAPPPKLKLGVLDADCPKTGAAVDAAAPNAGGAAD